MLDPATVLADLPAWAFAAILLIARIGTACTLLPGIGEAELPATVRVLFACAFAALVFPTVMPLMPPVPQDVPRTVLMVAAEVFNGLWLGWLARLMMLALPMAGQLVAIAIGTTNVLQPDAMLGGGASALSRMLGLAAPVLVMAAGLHALPLTALAGSYQLVPPGQFLPVAETTDAFVGAVGEAFALALRLAAPFLMAAMLFHASLGLIARLVPQLQTYFAAVPGQIAGGLALLGIAILAISNAWLDAAQHGLAAMPGL
jgi:flagellar biosynthetic protein FliR